MNGKIFWCNLVLLFSLPLLLGCKNVENEALKYDMPGIWLSDDGREQVEFSTTGDDRGYVEFLTGNRYVVYSRMGGTWRFVGSGRIKVVGRFDDSSTYDETWVIYITRGGNNPRYEFGRMCITGPSWQKWFNKK